MENYYLVGSPVGHSLSPAMMNLSFAHAGIDARYGLIDAVEHDLPAVVDRLRKDASGWNVTMPDKHAMSLLCDELSPAARIGGSVNTVKNDNGHLTGHTTDGTGFMNAVREAGFPVPGKKLTLLGSGGAAGAILIQAALDGASEISVFCNRPSSREHVHAIREKLREYSETQIRIFGYQPEDSLREEIQSSDILINATNIGMNTGRSSGPVCLIPDASFLHPQLFVYDIIYHPAKTPLICMAEENGIRAEGGLSMLIGQGAESFRIWTGCQMPLPEVRSLLLSKLPQ